MKVAVIGGAGFIGHHLVNKLLSTGTEVTVIDNLSTGKKENLSENCTFHQLDVRFDKLDDLLENVEVVYYLAAMARVQPSIENPLDYNEVNVTGLLKTLMSCVNKKVKKFVFSSSSSVYGETKNLPTKETEDKNPMSPYALQKLVGEQYCLLFNKLYNLDTVILRYFNVYGDNMPIEGAYRTVLGIFGEQFKNNKPFTITNDGEQKRDFTFVNDVVDANIRVGFYRERWNGECFNVGNGFSYSINEVVNFFGTDKKEFIGKKTEPKETLADNNKIKKYLGWEPKGDLEEWIKKYVEFLKK